MNLSFLLAAVLPLLRPHEREAAQSRIEDLYREYGYILRRRCRRILQDDSLVEDAMQEIFLTLYRCNDQYRGEPQKILAWLYRITTTQCLRLLEKDRRWLRHLAQEVEEAVPQAPSHNAPHHLDQQLALEQLLEQLPQEEVSAVVYRYVSGMTQEEIAEVMEVSRDQVRRWLAHFQQRGRVLLRDTTA